MNSHIKTALTERAPRCLKDRWKSVLALCAACAMATGLASAESRRDPAKIGVLWTSDPSRVAQYLQPFKESMRELGWIDGRTVHYVERYAYGDLTRVPVLAAELVALDVDVLFVTDYAVPAARQATKKIPIVCPNFYDPVLEGITKSMPRPGGNVTGVSWQSVESAAKRLQLTQELIPGLRRVGLLFDATDPGAVMEARGLLVSARRAGIDLKGVEVRGPLDFQVAFEKLKNSHLDALLVSVNPLTFHARDKIVGFATAIRLPLIAELPDAYSGPT